MATTFSHSLRCARLSKAGTFTSRRRDRDRIEQMRLFTSSSHLRQKADWSSQQYLKFGDERTIPVRDLLAKVPLKAPKRIIDLGCGPGNSTAVLAESYPDAEIIGMDSSADMLQKAKETLPNLEFVQGDLRTYTPDTPADLLFSNAAMHWVEKTQRIPVMKRLLRSQAAGSVLAIQVPDNANEPSHKAMHEAAKNIGQLKNIPQAAMELNTFATPRVLYEALEPFCSHINIWHTTYNHVLEDPRAIVEWVKGTGLRPWMQGMSSNTKQNFLREYRDRIKEAYEPLKDGKVMLRYPRLFMVAVRG